jgi:hypothetical protein
MFMFMFMFMQHVQEHVHATYPCSMDMQRETKTLKHRHEAWTRSEDIHLVHAALHFYLDFFVLTFLTFTLLHYSIVRLVPPHTPVEVNLSCQ